VPGVLGDDRAVELGLRAGAAGRAGVYLNLEPLVGAALGAAGLRQSLSFLALLGGVLIVAVAAIVASGRTPDSRF